MELSWFLNNVLIDLNWRSSNIATLLLEGLLVKLQWKRGCLINMLLGLSPVQNKQNLLLNGYLDLEQVSVICRQQGETMGIDFVHKNWELRSSFMVYRLARTLYLGWQTPFDWRGHRLPTNSARQSEDLWLQSWRLRNIYSESHLGLQVASSI